MMDHLEDIISQVASCRELDSEMSLSFPAPVSSPSRATNAICASLSQTDDKEERAIDGQTVAAMKAIPTVLEQEIPEQLDRQRLIHETGIPALKHILEDIQLKGPGHEQQKRLCRTQTRLQCLRVAGDVCMSPVQSYFLIPFTIQPFRCAAFRAEGSISTMLKIVNAQLHNGNEHPGLDLKQNGGNK
nr:TIMELESS-interacting protein-like [Dromaius novaehollandiae]